MATTAPDADVAWDLSPLLDGRSIEDLLDDAAAAADRLAGRRGQVAGVSAGDLAGFLAHLAHVRELVERAESYPRLSFTTDTADPARGAALQKVQERSSAITTTLLFFELEWAAVDDDRAAELLADSALDHYRHHLESARRFRPHLLSEPEE